MKGNDEIDYISEEKSVPNESDIINKTQKEMNDLKDIMKNNINNIVIRGDHLNDLHDSCDNLEVKANQFKTTCVKVERKMFLKNVKFKKIILTVVVLFLLGLVILILIYFLVIKRV